MFKRFFVLILLIVVSAALVGCGTSTSTGTDSGTDGSKTQDTQSKDPDYSFGNGVLITPEYKIEVTDYKIIPVGQEGNKYGDKPVIAFWYKVTNLTDKEIDPSIPWSFSFSAIQDNNPNAVNTLSTGMLPDSRFSETQLQKIKKDGTVENAWAYELSDETTPVKLQAKKLLGEVIGEQVYEIKK